MVFAYAGKPYDAVTGLSDYGFRDYASGLARFTTVDPICAKCSCDRKFILYVRSREHAIRDGSNWYAYCNSDPVNYVDAWGLVCISNNDAKAAIDSLIEKKADITDLKDIINTQEVAEKISRNINLFSDDDKTKAYYSGMPESVRTSAIKEQLNKLQVVTGVDRDKAEKQMQALGIDSDMANQIAQNGDAFSAGGYILFFKKQSDPETLPHEGIHTGLQESVYGDTGTYLTEYTNEAERLKANGDDWYYGNYFEKSAYAFGPENTSGNGGKYVHF